MAERGRQIAVDTAVDGATATVTLIGELDLDGATSVRNALEGLLFDEVTDVSVDTAGVTFLDSSGLRALLQARERLNEAGIGLHVDRPSDVVQRVLDITGTARLLITSR